MNPDGSNQVRLTANREDDIEPRLTKNGQTIVFVSERDGNKEIYSMNVDGTNQTNLTNSSFDDYSPVPK